jgi:hypothetical protein
MITLAHGLYIDDLLWFVVPVGLSLLALRWAERRAREKAQAAEVSAGAGDETAQAEEEAADRPAEDR